MSHRCEAALITCEDFRLHQRKDGRNYIADFIKERGVDCDLITRGGSVQDLVRPNGEGYRGCLLRDSNVSAELHGCRVVYLINHQDCGAYRGMDFNDIEEEVKQHISDLKEAREIILERFQDVRVETFFAYLREDSTDVFEIERV